MLTKRDIRSFDILLLILVCILVFIGITAIGSADHINIEGVSKANYHKQIIFFFSGLFLLLVAAFVDYNLLSRYYPLYYLIMLLLLVGVIALGTGDVRRWFYFGSVSIQPSEFAKLIMIYCNAKLIDKLDEKVNNILILILLIMLTLIPVVLIREQPSLSACLVLVAILAGQLFVGKISYKYVIPVVALLVIGASIALWDASQEQSTILSNVMREYQINRIRAMIDPEKFPEAAYQTLKSMQATGSGQLYGKGLYEGTLNKLSYLPEPNNDFIFAVIGEEFGFIGCMSVLILLLLIILRCLIIAYTTKDNFGRLIASGVAFMLAFQTFVNTGVASGILPNTGMSLPFVSSGGSSMWTNMIAIGLVINIGMMKPKSLFEGE